MKRIIEKHERIARPRKKAWCTPPYKKMIKKQHKLHKRKQENPTTENIKAHANYARALNKKIKQQKKQYLTQQLQATRLQPKQQAKILQSIIPRKAKGRTSPTVLTYENRTHTEPVEIANALNDFFITIGHKTSKSIRIDEHIEQEDEPNERPDFELRHVHTEDLIKIMKKMKRNKASDIYKIKPTIMRDLTEFIAPIITELINTSIDEGDYPDALKLTKVIELYKAKDRTLPKNYRPISLLPIIAKLVDTLFNNQLMEHLTKHNIISPTQYAFRPNSSTTLALQTILDQLRKHKNDKQPTLAIYIDLSKAYDTISHEKLLHKLQHDFNFTPHTVSIFRAYLTNRQQSTHTQHAQSKVQTITHGIPQGSTLSTTFFLLYINEIVRTVPQSTVYTYADDTTLIITAGTVEQLQKLAQTELNNLIRYFHTNNLVPNPTKTNYSLPPDQPTQDIPPKIRTTTPPNNPKHDIGPK